MSFRRILVAVDASAASRDLEAWTRELARLYAAQVRLVTVVPDHRAYEFYGEFAPLQGAAKADAQRDREEAIAAQEQVAARLRRARIRTALEVREGDPATEIVAAVSEWKAQLLIIGSNARKRLGRAIFGSVVDSVKHRVRSSLLIARSPPTPKILFACADGSPPSRRAVALGTDLAHTWRSHLFVYHVLRYSPGGPWDKSRMRLPEGFERFLDKSSDALVTRHVAIGGPAQALLAAARKRQADLVLLGASGMGRIERWLLGSVADRLSHLWPKSLLIVREA